MNRPLSVQARFYIGAVILVGFAAGVHLVFTMTYRPGDWAPLAIFGTLSVIAAAISFSYRGSMPTGASHHIGSSFTYPLLVLVSPGAVCLICGLTTLADLCVHRRRLRTIAFNLAQLSLAVWAAVTVRDWIEPGSVRLNAVEPRSMIAAFVSIVVFAVVNHTLTHVVVSLAARRTLLRWDWFTRVALFTEALCILSGLGMAVFWSIHPGLVLLGAFPIGTLFFMLRILARREQALENRELELHSLQGLGLEIGSELDSVRLHRAVLRVACDALEASGAVLATRDPKRDRFVTQAHRGIDPAPPAEIPARDLDGDWLEQGRIVIARGDGETRSRFPGLAGLGAGSSLLAPLEIQGGRTGLLILVHDDRRRTFDESDRRRLRTLVRFIDMALSNAELVADLQAAHSQLAQSEKISALGMLVSGVAHELNNPLTSILGFSELLVEREPDARKRRMLDRISGEARRAAKTVRTLLTFSRKHKMERQLLNINEAIEHVLEFRNYELSVRNVQVVRHLSPVLPLVLADPHQLEQVFINLITNAEQAITENRGSGKITVATEVRGAAVRIVIADNGPGIDSGQLDQVFLPFFSTKEIGRGTGLGLAICYGIVEEHGGRISVESGKGKGARFTLTLPAADSAQATEVKRTHEPAAVAQSLESFRGRLLVVDDELSIVQVLTEYFQARGWAVLSAQDGAQALELIGGVDFHALVVDMRMPGMDGPSFFEQLSALRPDLADRVVFATGDLGSEATRRFLKDRGNAVLRKPFDLGQLAAAISKIVEDDTDRQQPGIAS